MRPSLLVILLLTLLFTPVGVRFQSDGRSDSYPAQEIEEPMNLERVYGKNLAYEIVSVVSYSGYRNYVQEFTENGSRWVLDALTALEGANMEARNYLLNKMSELSDGRMETEVVGNHHNVIGKIPGYLPGNNPAIVIAGHYDSFYTSMGANEGASGIAVLLELMEPLSSYEWPLDIYFVALNARYAQWGPFGSDEVARYFFNEEIEVLALYSVEALLVENPYAPSDERVFMVYLDMGQSNYHMSQYWADLGKVMSKNYGNNWIKPEPSYNLSVYGSPWYDHNYFFNRGFMNIIVPFESGYSYDDAYKTNDDTWVNPNYRYPLGAEITRAIGASIAYTMFREYGVPTHHESFIEIYYGGEEIYYIPITTPTNINVTSRWFGGTTSFTLLDPSDNVIAFQDYDHPSAWEFTDVFSEPVIQKGIYTLVIDSTGITNIGYELHYSYDSDIDGNDVLDSEEYWLDTALFHQDSDNDSISDADEIILGTDVNSVDSDSDTMPDSYEIKQGFDPRDPADGTADADGDSLSNAEEYYLGLNPWRSDSDFDKLPDDWEIEYGLDPLVMNADQDPDNDGKTNLDEFLDGTDPLFAEVETIEVPWFVLPFVAIVSLIVVVSWVMNRESGIME